jgi:hypothetical protein
MSRFRSVDRQAFYLIQNQSDQTNRDAKQAFNHNNQRQPSTDYFGVTTWSFLLPTTKRTENRSIFLSALLALRQCNLTA